jgi:hypothetical protein
MKMLDAPGLNGGVSSISGIFENSGPIGGIWGDPFFEKKEYGRKKIVSASFDPTTGQCGVCSGCHLGGGGGGGGGGVGGAVEPAGAFFFVADQAFLSGLLPAAADGCVTVMRQEFGSLGELCDMFIEYTRGCVIPAGSVILVSSLTHLADVGISAYAADLCAFASKITRVFQGSITVLPGLPYPPAGVADPGLVRELMILLEWSAKVTAVVVVGGGGTVLEQCYLELKGHFMEVGTGNVQAEYGVRYRLPSSFN